MKKVSRNEGGGTFKPLYAHHKWLRQQAVGHFGDFPHLALQLKVKNIYIHKKFLPLEHCRVGTADLLDEGLQGQRRMTELLYCGFYFRQFASHVSVYFKTSLVA